MSHATSILRAARLAAAGVLFTVGCQKASEPSGPPPPSTPTPPLNAPPKPPAPPAGPPGIPAPADVAAPPGDAEKTPSGLASKVQSPGTGTERPTARDLVQVHYTGWTKDGHMFDSSIPRGMPTRFPLNRVIPGWTEGLQLMQKGEKRRFWIPAALAYGETPARPGAPSGQLTFDVELIDFIKSPAPVPGPIKAPKDVKAPPKSAKKTASGISYTVLTKGKGEKHPGPTTEVGVIYTGWTTDGKMFDSSAVNGEVVVFPLNRVIPGWTEGVQLMVEGEKTRFWIPGNLAYGDTPSQPGAPAGTLVFEVELLKIF